MTFVEGIPEKEATGKVRKIYDKELRDQGFVRDTTKVFSIRPEFIEAWHTLDNALKANMEERYYELATIASTSSIRCTV
jgi:alkylhydroperoxidase/carboxymuconolactone decarboxylase family protein YurZ